MGLPMEATRRGQTETLLPEVSPRAVSNSRRTELARARPTPTDRL